RCEAGITTGRGVGGLVSARQESSHNTENTFDPPGLSGLALAGANHRATVGENEEDGVITALEIANLDLSEVEWAVLSACDSGVGESISGEGVFGFRRAFRIAGAHTVIMSLWPVEDASGQAWMEALYRARLLLGMTTAESVRYAGLELLQARRDRNLSTHPFYWGAFMAAGDWR
ncbi:MAG: CHAT domain-containing protein, partial [Acidobacteriota bacterium]